MPKIDISEEVLNKVAGEEMKKLRAENSKLKRENLLLKNKIDEDKIISADARRLYGYLRDVIRDIATDFDLIKDY
jgi:cell division protein FtsB